MTALVLTQVFPPAHGGSGRWLYELYRRVPGLSVHAVADVHPQSAAFDATSGLRTDRIPLSFSSWGVWHLRSGFEYLRAFRSLVDITRRVSPDTIHCGKCLPEGLLARRMARRLGIPFVCYVHGEEISLARTSRELSRLTRGVLREASLVVANSHHTRALLLDAWQMDTARVVVMHPGVDTTLFVPARRSEETRRRLGWSNRRVVLTVGALQKRKGQDMLIRALPAIRARCPDVLYAIVGEGWERPYLEGLVTSLGLADAVQFRGAPRDAELLECYQQCDVFALPNRQVGWDFEGFGIALIEAQACGKPVIAGQSGGTVDTLDPGSTGLIVASEDPDPLGAAVVSLLDSPSTQADMGARARVWAEEHFDWAPLTRQAVELFARLS